MMEEFNEDTNEMVFAPSTAVESFTVSVTVSKKHLGDLISITVGETRKAEELLTAGETAVARRNVAEDLLVQANAICNAEVEQRGAVQAAAVRTANVGAAFTQTATATNVPAGTMTVSAPVVGVGAPAVHAVANGAPVGNDGWMSVPNKFGDGDMRFRTTAVYPSQQLEADVNAWLMSKGLNPQFFKCWDNRPGQRGLEAGTPQGCVANIKLQEGAPGSEQLGKAAAARVKFNSNGSLYIWLTKEFEAALKFVGQMLAPAGAPVQNPFQ
jgi:hypothetical protein